MSLAWQVVPIQRWPGDETRERQQDRFGHRGRGVDWSDTTSLLDRELRHLGASNILLQMAVTERDIRNDGWIRANAVPAHPGVILTFESRHYGPLSYPCDAFRRWQANVRAIALALEALRKVDRYGVTKRGEQYTGWKQLPPAGGSTSSMGAQEAARVLVEAEGRDGDPDDVLASAEAARFTYRNAARATHPDAGGSDAAFQLVQEAKQRLGAHFGARL